MESTRPQHIFGKAGLRLWILIGVVAITAFSAVGLYAVAGSSTNTIEIIPIVSGAGAGGSGSSGLSGVPVTIVPLGFKYRSEDVDDEGGLGIVVSRIDRPVGLQNGTLLIEMVWSNSIDAAGQLTKPGRVISVDLYFEDRDQREADDDLDEYNGDCDELTQRNFKVSGVTTWLCPDTSNFASANLSFMSAYGIIGSNTGAHDPLYVLAHVPVSDDDDEEDEKGNGKGKGKGNGNGNDDGTVNTGQIQQMEFRYIVLTASET